jgi:hypothetical protein
MLTNLLFKSVVLFSSLSVRISVNGELEVDAEDMVIDHRFLKQCFSCEIHRVNGLCKHLSKGSQFFKSIQI